MLLQNEKISLRALEPEDLEQLYQWENDTTLWELGCTLSPYSRYLLKNYIADSDIDLYAKRQLRLMIVLKTTGESIGTIDLYDFEPHHRRAGIGVLVDVKHQNRGFARESLLLMEQYAFTFLKLHQLYAYIPVSNKSSLHLFERCGYEEIGVMPEWLMTLNGYVDVKMVTHINKLDAHSIEE